MRQGKRQLTNYYQQQRFGVYLTSVATLLKYLIS